MQAEEYLSPSVVTVLSRAIADNLVPAGYASRPEVSHFVAEMAPRLAHRVPDYLERRDLATLHYEAIRAGLDPQLVLGVMHHESGFKKYAVSSADARGYMHHAVLDPSDRRERTQSLPPADEFRYGCVILRHYLDRENGDLFRALGRYNGSLGRSEYLDAVAAAMRRYESQSASTARIAMPVTIGAAVPGR